jgi:uncharacterized protein (TIGR03086 family)
VEDTDLLDQYEWASAWTLTAVGGAVGQLDRDTLCDGWDVRTLLNHMLDTQRYFTGAARGEQVPPPSPSPSPSPPELLGEDPVASFEQGRADLLHAFGEPGVIDSAGPSLGIAFVDQLLHGWDLATATGQDATMPANLPEAAYRMIHGRITDEQRKGIFKPAIAVAQDASAQDKLLAYTGRNPSS